MNERKKYYIVYTIGFFFVSIGAFFWYFAAGRTFIWQSDGWDQVYKGLIYEGRYLRTFLKNILYNHKLILPSWDFSIGEGSDILEALHYHVLGDPLTLFSIFVPTKYVWVLYNCLILLRLYLAGLFFSMLCFQTNQKNIYGILAGSYTYSFCAFALLNTARHPYFLNPLIYLPLLIMGVENIIKKKQLYLMIAAVFLSAISNFYFFYKLVLMIVIYVTFRLFFLYQKNMINAIRPLVYIFWASVTGVLLASFIFLPVMLMIVKGDRMSLDIGFRLFYPLKHYSKLPSILISTNNSYWLYMGYSTVTIPALFLI